MAGSVDEGVYVLGSEADAAAPGLAASMNGGNGAGGNALAMVGAGGGANGAASGTSELELRPSMRCKRPARERRVGARADEKGEEA